jgi:type I restriction enzyme R subunit
MEADAAFFAAAAGMLRKNDRAGVEPGVTAEQAVKQFMSKDLAAGEIVDVLALAGDDRPNLSVLSDQFLDTLGGAGSPRTTCAGGSLERLVADEVRVQERQNPLQAASRAATASRGAPRRRGRTPASSGSRCMRPAIPTPR